MGEVFHAFGIDWRLIVIQVFNFTLMMAVLWYFLYTPVLNLLKERREKIEKGITDAEEAARAREEAEAEKRSILTEANVEAESISARARAHADEEHKEIVAKAEERASAIVTEAEGKSVLLKEEAVRASEAEIAKMAVLAAEKVLKEKA